MLPALVGRDDECKAIDALLTATREGLSGCLVLHGDAGMGKTTLLDYAADAASGFRVLRLVGVESEVNLGFAAMQRLLEPFLQVEVLSTRQRNAINSAFGLDVSEPADRFIFGLAALSILAHAARSQPLLCLIDDAEWIDQESLDALTFVARRLGADRVAMLFAVRGASSRGSAMQFDGLSSLGVEGLHEEAALELLSRVVERPVDDDVARRIVRETRGCPLAVVELSRSLTAEQLASGDVLLEPSALSGRLEQHFLAHVWALPPEAQTFLVLAAADGSADPSILWRAAFDLGIPPSAADAALAADLIAIDQRVEFRHPLIRSAILSGATADARRTVHIALANACDVAGNADRRALHLAAASISTDEQIAAELQRCGERAASSGRYADEAVFYERAAALTPEFDRRAERLLSAAHAHIVAGTHRAAETALNNAQPYLRDPILRARAQRLIAALESFTLPNEIPALLLETARTLEPLDARLARDTYTEAIEAVLVSGQLTKGTTAAEIARAALAAPAVPGSETTVADLMLEGFSTRFTAGYAAAAPMLRRAVTELARSPFEAPGIARGATLGNNAAADLWDVENYGAMLHALERTERERGALDSLRITLGGLGHYDMWTGRFALAEDRHSEAVEISRTLGADARVWHLLKVELFAWQGREADTRAAVGALLGPFTRESGAGVAVNLARIALTVLELAQGHSSDAFDAAWPLYQDDIPPHGSQALPEIVEAAVRSGNVAHAEDACARLEERAAASGTAWARGLFARSKALLQEGAAAEASYCAAIEHLATTVIKTDLARAHLLYGEWLRRQRRPRDAHEHLALAFEMFETMGAAAFAERARGELKAAGATASRRTVDTSSHLTAQEHQVARLAASGATNNEIASEVFISASTVDYHLRKIYRKLGITSRRQLRTAALD